MRGEMFWHQRLTSNVLPCLAWCWPPEVEQAWHLDSVSGLNWPVKSPQPPHLTSTTTLLPRLLLLFPLLLFSFSQDTAGDQILLVSVSAIGDQIPEWGEEEERRGLWRSLLIFRLGTEPRTIESVGRTLLLSLGLTGLWRHSRLIGNFLKSKISEDGESGVSGEASLVLRFKGVVCDASSVSWGGELLPG